jgi:hypothetical protein
MMALYNLWLARNNAREKEMIEHPDKTAARVLMLNEEWQALKEAKTPKLAVVTHWCPLAAGWHKANADGAFSVLEENGGGGVILRDPHGLPIAGSRFFPYRCRPGEGGATSMPACGGACPEMQGCRNWSWKRTVRGRWRN